MLAESAPADWVLFHYEPHLQEPKCCWSREGPRMMWATELGGKWGWSLFLFYLSKTLAVWNFKVAYIYNFLGGGGKHTLLHLKSESCRYVMLVESRHLFMPHCFTESVTSCLNKSTMVLKISVNQRRRWILFRRYRLVYLLAFSCSKQKTVFQNLK